MKIRTKINLSFLSVFLTIFLFAGVVVGVATNNLLANLAYERIKTLNGTKAEHIKTYLNSEKEVVLSLAASTVFRDFLKQKPLSAEFLVQKEITAQRLARSIGSVKQIYELFILDKIGKIVVSTNGNLEGADKSTDPYFTSGQKQVFIKDLYFSDTVHRYTYTVSAPILDDKTSELLGVIVARMDPQILYEIVGSELVPTKSGESFLINSDRYLLTPMKFLGEDSILKQQFNTQNAIDCFDPKDVQLALDPNNTEAIKEHLKKELPLNYLDYRNVPIIGTHSYISDAGWCLITKVDRSEALSASYQLFGIFIVIAILAVFIFIVTGFGVSRKFTKPILDLQEGIEIIQNGNLDYKVGSKQRDEIGTLSRAFDYMTASIKQSYADVDKKVREQTLEIQQRSKDAEDQRKAILNILEDVDEERRVSQGMAEDLKKFQLAVENASDHIVITDSDGIILYANKGVLTITGFNTEEVIGQKAGAKNLWGGLMDLEFYRELWKVIKEEKKTFSGEINNKRKNGERYVAQAAITPIVDESGTVKFFVGIERDITKAKEIDRMKTDFISLASHQLRTPLSAMKWFSEMLIAGDAGKLTAEQEDFVQNIYESNERMIALVDSLLNISRIESGRLIIDPKPTNIGEVVDSLITELKQKIEEKKMKVVVSVHKELPMVNVDPKLVRNVYLNLMTNAIKYTPAGGEISVFVSRKGDDLISQVTDNGYGIKKEEQGKIFQRFFRASNVTTKEPDGTGLGLYLAKAVIESSGGKIWFESEEGKGTTFWFSLPIAGMVAKKGEVTLDS